MATDEIKVLPAEAWPGKLKGDPNGLSARLRSLRPGDVLFVRVREGQNLRTLQTGITSRARQVGVKIETTQARDGSGIYVRLRKEADDA